MEKKTIKELKAELEKEEKKYNELVRFQMCYTVYFGEYDDTDPNYTYYEEDYERINKELEVVRDTIEQLRNEIKELSKER